MLFSICIPTYNRSSELATLLESIATQTGYAFDLEVVISDNASKDDTREVVERFRDRLPRLVYSRLDENQGADRNFLRVIELAKSDYCWLFGSDDKLEPGALQGVEQALLAHPGVAGISVGAQGYDSSLTTKIFIPDPIATGFDRPTLLEGRSKIVKRIGHAFGYLSSLVVNRSLWMECANTLPVTQYFNSYIHVYIILNMLAINPTWMCLPDQLVGWRSGNDSFLGDGRFNRLRIDVEGYDQNFGDTLGRDDSAYRRVMATVAGEHIKIHFLTARMVGEKHRFWAKARPLAMKHFYRYPSFWLKVFPLYFTPRPVLVAARSVYRAVLKPKP